MKKLTSIILIAGMVVMLAGVAFAATSYYTVSVNPTAYGVVAVDKTSAAAADTVRITAVPSEGYSLALLTVYDASGASITVKTLSEAAYSFTMPASNVSVTATFVSSGSGSETTAFKDVAKSDWFYDAVVYVSDKELMTGESGSFNPGGTMTRGMVVTILYRLAGSPGLVGQPAFSDVAPGDAYAKPVLWASQNGITNGCGNGAFGVNDAVSREQLVTFLNRYAKLKNYDLTASADLAKFADVSAVDSYARSAMQWAVGAGIVQGEGSTLAPLSTGTRAQAAAILMRFCKTYVK